MNDVEIIRIASAFHAAYEQEAPLHGYVTNEATRCQWDSLPVELRLTMTGTVQRLIHAGIIAPGRVVAAEVMTTP